MSIHIEQYENEPIVVVTPGSDYDMAVELPAAKPIHEQLLGQVPEPVFWIVNSLNLAVETVSVEALLIGADALTHGVTSLYHHPKIRQVIYVVQHPGLRAAILGMKEKPLDKINISITETLEEALTLARNQL